MFHNGNPNRFNVCNAKGTDKTLIKHGNKCVRLAGSKKLKSGPHISAKNKAGTAFQPKYTKQRTLAAWGK